MPSPLVGLLVHPFKPFKTKGAKRVLQRSVEILV